jgi:hypothetical protein
MSDNPDPSATPDLDPGSLAWRITVATLAHRFFGLIHDAETAKLIDQPADAGKAGAWPLVYFTLYLQKRGIPTGETTDLARMQSAAAIDATEALLKGSSPLVL